MATTTPVILSAEATTFAGETVTIPTPILSFAPGSAVSVAIETGKSRAGTFIETIQGTGQGRSVTFTLPTDLSGAQVYFSVVEGEIVPYITPDYTWENSPDPVGDMPEVPIAAALPVMGLVGVAVVAYARRRSRTL